MRAVIPVSLPESDGQMVGRAATLLDEPLSAFMREASVARARAVLAEAPSEPDVVAPAA